MDLAAVTEVSKANLAGASQVLEQREEKVTLGGRTFSHVISRARNDAMNLVLRYEHWIATERGFAWQFIFWSRDTEGGGLASQSRSVMETFKLLDPTMDGGGKGLLKDVSRPENGYATKLAGMGWNSWSDPARQNALLDFGAQRLNEALVIVPVRFGPQEPPDTEALCRGLLQTMNLDYPSEGDCESTPWSPGQDFTGMELKTEHESDGDHFHYILRVARGKHSAHLVAGWAVDGKGDIELVRRSLDAVTVQEPSGPAPTLTAAQKTAYGIMLNEVGLSYFDRKDHAQAAFWLQQAFDQTKEDPVILENAGHALEDTEEYVKGRDFLAPHVGRFPKHFDLGVRFARLQTLAGDVDAGNATFLSIIERGFKDENDLLPWLNLLTSKEHYPQAIRAAEAWVAKQPSVTTRRWLAQTVFLSGKQEEALAMFEKLMEENPKDVKIAYDLGEYYNEAGENTKAAAVAEKLLADGKEAPRALMMLGWSQMGRKWYRDAKTTFERAAKKQPDNTEVQEAIQRASAMLGQGDNSSIREPLELVAIPEAVITLINAQKQEADFGKGYPSAWLMRGTGWHFEKGKPLRKTVHRRVKVLTAEGARAFSSVEISFDPLGERIFMNRLEVKDADGQPVAKANVADAYVRDLGDGTATHRKVLHMQVAGVQPGNVVEWEVTTEDRFNADAFDFQRCLFANGLPVASEAVFVTGDISAVKACLSQDDGLKTVRAEKLMAWVAPPQPPAPEEPWSIWPERRCPMLWLGSNLGTWKSVARDYIKQIEDRLEPDKSLDTLAKKLTAGLSTPAEKAGAIGRYVQKEYAYKAIEFGVRARRPMAVAETINQRYGDCKDLALLLHHLLRAAGVVSHLTLVNTNWQLQPDLPSLDQFNHMIVHVPDLGKNWLIDATDKTLDLAHHSAGGLWHAHTLILDKADPRLLPPPAGVPSGSCEIASNRSVTPSGNDWHVQETLTLQGYFAASMRDGFLGMSGDEQSRKAQNILASYGPAQLEDFRFEHLDDPTKPAVLHLTYKLRSAVGAGGTAAIPALWEKNYLETAYVKDRRTSFEQRYPMHFTSDVKVELPSTPLKESLAEFKQQGDSEFCKWKLECAPQAESGRQEVAMHFEFVTKTGEHPAARYASSHNAWEAARSSWDRHLAWKAK